MTRRELPEHIPVLDGLRGLAVLYVLVQHLLWFAPDHTRFDSLVHRVVIAGWVGVDLFFVLSGFLITRILLQAKGSDRYFSSFYARRVLRIFPVYYGVVGMLLVVLPAVSPGWREAIASDITMPGHLWTYTVNLVAPFRTGRMEGVSHFWSLMVEEHFYFVWPLVVLLLSRRGLVRACFACFAISAIVRFAMLHAGLGGMAVYGFTPARLDGLAMGALIAIVIEERGLTPGLARFGRWGPLAVAPALVAVAVHDTGFYAYGQWVTRVGYFFLAVFWGTLVVRLLTAPASSWVRAFFESRPMRFFGKYSYGAYVYHLPLIAFVFTPLELHAWLQGRLRSDWAGSIAFFLLATTLVYGLAIASYELVERRFLRLKRYFEFGPRAVGAPIPVSSSSSERAPS